MSTNRTEYPWHSGLYERLASQRAKGQLPHALLFTGPPGIGKEAFLYSWVSGLICKTPLVDERFGQQACGECDSCRQHLAGSYPDCLVLSPEPDNRRVFENYPPQSSQARERARKTPRTIISVDQVRELIDWLGQSSHNGELRVVLLLPADALNKEAANALLKALEEPPADTLFVLLSERPLNLLATLRSRCQRIDFPVPDRDGALEWLGAEYPVADRQRALLFAAGAPRHAQDLLVANEMQRWLEPIEQLTALITGSTSLLQVAGDWERHDRVWLTGLLQGWLRILVGRHAGLTETDEAVVGKHLRVQSDGLHLDGVFELFGLLNGYVATQNIALNKRLLWEDFLLVWQRQCLTKKKVQK